MKIAASSVENYLSKIPEDRRAALQAVRETIRKNLDSGYEEGLQYGMIGYYVPHRIFPAGYHCDPKQPLPFAGLASQKNHMAVYLMCIYMDPSNGKWFVDKWKKTGKKLDAGKSCIRFTRVEDLALDVIGECIRRWPAQAFVDRYQKLRGQTAGAQPKTTRKPVAKSRR